MIPKDSPNFDQRIKELQIALEGKQDQIYDLEKKLKSQNLSKIEEGALDTLKRQLREAHHNSELLKIENEELIKQLEDAEGKTSELQIKVADLTSALVKKDKAI